MTGHLTAEVEDADRQTLLNEWAWLLKSPAEVVLVTAMGDAFIADERGQVLFLDTLEGKLLPTTHTPATLLADFPRNVPGDWLNAGMLELKARQEQRLKPGDCYSYMVPPILGGPLDSSNVRPVNAVAHFCFTGQVHGQISALPAGTRITGIEVVGQARIRLVTEPPQDARG